MLASSANDLIRLSEGLAALLAHEGVTQMAVAAAVGVDQGYVSRARHGQIKRATARSARLLGYVNMRLEEHRLPVPVTDAAKAFLASGGDPAVLAQSIRLLLAVRTG